MIERELNVISNGHASKYPKLGTSSLQGSVLGLIFFNILFNNLVDLIPQGFASADDCTISFSGIRLPE